MGSLRNIGDDKRSIVGKVELENQTQPTSVPNSPTFHGTGIARIIDSRGLAEQRNHFIKSGVGDFRTRRKVVEVNWERQR